MSTWSYLDVFDDLFGALVCVRVERFERGQDGPVAGAAAQVAIHVLLHRLWSHSVSRLQQTEGEGRQTSDWQSIGNCITLSETSTLPSEYLYKLRTPYHTSVESVRETTRDAMD